MYVYILAYMAHKYMHTFKFQPRIPCIAALINIIILEFLIAVHEHLLTSYNFYLTIECDYIYKCGYNYIMHDMSFYNMLSIINFPQFSLPYKPHIDPLLQLCGPEIAEELLTLCLLRHDINSLKRLWFPHDVQSPFPPRILIWSFL